MPSSWNSNCSLPPISRAWAGPVASPAVLPDETDGRSESSVWTRPPGLTSSIAPDASRQDGWPPSVQLAGASPSPDTATITEPLDVTESFLG